MNNKEILAQGSANWSPDYQSDKESCQEIAKHFSTVPLVPASEAEELRQENERLQKQVVELREALGGFMSLGVAHFKTGFSSADKEADEIFNEGAKALTSTADLTGKVLVDRGQWQPIETAPKDGTEILAALDCTGWVGLVTWGNGCWYETAAPDPAEPTHWMPLPEPPKQEALGEESK